MYLYQNRFSSVGNSLSTYLISKTWECRQNKRLTKYVGAYIYLPYLYQIIMMPVSYQRFMRNKLLLSRCGSAQIYCLLMYANWGTNGMTLRITYLSCTAYLNSYVGITSYSVMRVGSDTFGNPIFQKGLQN